MERRECTLKYLPKTKTMHNKRSVQTQHIGEGIKYTLFTNLSINKSYWFLTDTDIKIANR